MLGSPNGGCQATMIVVSDKMWYEKFNTLLLPPLSLFLSVSVGCTANLDSVALKWTVIFLVPVLDREEMWSSEFLWSEMWLHRKLIYKIRFLIWRSDIHISEKVLLHTFTEDIPLLFYVICIQRKKELVRFSLSHLYTASIYIQCSNFSLDWGQWYISRPLANFCARVHGHYVLLGFSEAFTNWFRINNLLLSVPFADSTNAPS